jgi:hypothetical protein
MGFFISVRQEVEEVEEVEEVLFVCFFEDDGGKEGAALELLDGGRMW